MSESVPALQGEIDRVARRLRTLGPARLDAPLKPYGRTAAGVAHDLAQALADVAAAAEAAGQQPVSRPLPSLPSRAVGDQVAVCGHDAVRALAALSAHQRVVTTDGHREDIAALTRFALEQVRALYAALP